MVVQLRGHQIIRKRSAAHKIKQWQMPQSSIEKYRGQSVAFLF
jgi:hypothetical protein